MNASAAEVAEHSQTQNDAYYCEIPNDPCAIVMFGASGDLAKRKLLPALFDLAWHSCLAPRFRVLGFARTEMSDDQFRKEAAEALSKGESAKHQDKQSDFFGHLHYFSGQYDEAESFNKLAKRLDELDQEGNLCGNRLFYLATPPDIYPKIIKRLGESGLAKPKSAKCWTRVIIEKPFGHDLDSARELNRTVLGVFDESQVYRIDHYLGKQTVQNLLVFRFGNGIFEPIWNRNYIDHVQITAGEMLGVEARAAFYEGTGALRDMVQSHLLQLASLVSMEAPAKFDATAVRNEKIKILQSIRPFTPDTVHTSVVRGQYAAGIVNGKPAPGYREEKGVKRDSKTETYVALKLQVDNWRWSGVPFYLRTGKRLARQFTEIAIQFKEAPHLLFQNDGFTANWLVLNIQPDEGISLSFGAKAPGSGMDIRPVTMDFQYRQTFGGVSREAYATLLNDCIRGDATLFDRADSVEAAWGLVDPILKAWQGPSDDITTYPSGGQGPGAADVLIQSDGRRWRTF
jgi:glucose-6-phosphate 1-dehydrogenase